jgi:hypothetical protein
LNEILPDALAWGVDYNLFWKLTPKTLEPFRKAEVKRLEAKAKDMDILAWMVGKYTVHALSFLGNQPNYPNQPDTMSDSQEGQNDDAWTDAERFEAFAIQFNHQERFK